MRRRAAWLGAAVWCVPAALATLQTYTEDNPADCGGSLWRAAAREATPWLVWAIATPLILRATARPAPFAGRRVLRHVAAAAAIAIAYGAINGAVGELVRRTPSGLTIGGALWMGFLDWLPVQPLFYTGVAAVGVALYGAQRRREDEVRAARLEGELATARLAALRAQLQPHFLFNTLNAAVALARAGDADACARVLVLLGELLRELLRGDAPHEVPLREELALVEKYIAIQRVRFGDRLRVSWQIDDAVRDALVPQLVLQPLVENAFRHGLARRAGAGALEIAAARIGADLELVVRDDGPGPAEPVALGVGLRNTQERLRELYGVRSTVVLAGDARGARATVVIPLHVAAPRGSADAAPTGAPAEAAGALDEAASGAPHGAPP